MPSADVKGTTIHYRKAGGGPTTVYIHGFPFDHSMWLNQLGGLAHMRLGVAPDLRGFGGSPRVFSEPLTMERHADDIAALIESKRFEQVDVVGLSMGGYVALAMWERHPSLFRSLVLASTRAREDTPEGKVNRERSAAQLVADGKDRWGGLMTEALVASRTSTDVRARMRSMIDRASYESIVAALLGMRDRPDRTQTLSTITVPTLVATGERDRLILPEEGEAMAAAIPGSRYVDIPGAGHMAPMEAPEYFNEALESFYKKDVG